MLNFGTSGLRGLVADMTDEECYINARGFLQYLLQAGQIKAGDRVSLAGDLRASTDRIMRAVGRAILDLGCQPENCGKIPSPAVMFHALAKQQASIMVTGSHIPDDRNGIKFNKHEGEVLKNDEPGILREVKNVRQEDHGKLFAAKGMFHHGQAPALPEVNPEAETGYVDRYLRVWPGDALAGKRVVVEQHSAVGRDLLVKILASLGAEVEPVGRSDQFIPRDTENVTPETRINFRKLARQYRPFAIVSTDGDSDRPFVVDEEGGFNRGDIVGAVVARYLGARFAAVPISANDAINFVLRESGVERVQTRIGSPYVIAAMQDGLRANREPVVGWEVNGGFMLGSDVRLSKGVLKALPTRDAVLPIVATLLAACEKGGVKALFAEMPRRFTQAGLIDNFPQNISQKLVAELMPENPQVRQITYHRMHCEWGFIDGHEEKKTIPYVPEAPLSSRAFWKHGALAGNREWSVKKLLEKYYFTPAYGFNEITQINVVDGIRITFANQNVAHIRPSGNAPQLRIYATANSQERADEIVQFGLASDGILRRIEKDISV